MSSFRSVAALTTLVAGILVTAGCGSDTVDASKAEEGIESASLGASTIQVKSASCPEDVEQKDGGTFTCDVALDDGGEAQVTVTQTSGRNTFSYALKPGSVVLPGSTVDKVLEQDLADAGAEGATVNCPSSVPVKIDASTTCPFTTASGRQGTVSFEFSDDAGSVDSSSVEQS
jgi:Domain of unknown function (DUF4333)